MEADAGGGHSTTGGAYEILATLSDELPAPKKASQRRPSTKRTAAMLKVLRKLAPGER